MTITCDIQSTAIVTMAMEVGYMWIHDLPDMYMCHIYIRQIPRANYYYMYQFSWADQRECIQVDNRLVQMCCYFNIFTHNVM